MASLSDSTLYLYTSLTAGSSHIITATSRLETILKANKIPFRAVDCATDEKARMLWGRRANGRKLPGLVKFGNVIGDIEQVEEWNEFGELTEQIEAADFAGVNPDAGRSPHPSAALPLDIKPPDASSSGPPSRGSSQGRHISITEPKPPKPSSVVSPKSAAGPGEAAVNAALRQVGAEAAAKGAQRKTPAASGKPAEPADGESAATKAPTPLAAEGQTKTRREQIEAVESKPAVSSDAQDTSPTDRPISGKSTQEHVVDLDRSSTQTKQASRVSESRLAADSSHQVLPEEAPESSRLTASSQPEALESAEKETQQATKSLDD
ncbi:hypothetical protein DV737_g5636, partial [Chaetothyriales sp. CBS 132003]